MIKIAGSPTLVCAALLLATALRADDGALPAAKPFPLIEGLGRHHRDVSHASSEGQRYFDQGMALYYGFNDGTAIRSLKAAESLSPGCAMIHWALALAEGPNINSPMTKEAVKPAWDELQAAEKLAPSATPEEQALIRALTARYQEKPPEDRSALDQAYATSMRSVWKQFPKDADIGTLFAEALMDLRPWDQWSPDGKAQPGTDEVISTLEAVLALDLQHPYANHLYIHALEASSHPEKAIPAADRLLTLQPILAHNVHMPSHIYIRVGRWQDAIDSNAAAVAAHQRIEAIIGPAPATLSIYNAHDEHMLAYAAMMIGQSDVALRHARAAVACLASSEMTDPNASGGYFLIMPLEVLVRFGRWDDILADKETPGTHVTYLAYRHAARAIAFAAKGNDRSARSEQAAFTAALKNVPTGPYTFSLNAAAPVMKVVALALDGELSVREGHIEEGIAQLRKAVAGQDQLGYDEPPPWLIPARHSLGAALLNAGHLAEAEAVYREDLRRLPNNGWSLYGLATTLRLEKRDKEAMEANDAFHRAWARADVEIDTSCLCQSPIAPSP